MGRWRPPVAPSTPYITAAGFAALEAEMKAIWQRRREVVKALAAAAAEGDRSENAEYIYRKKELGGLDRRIRYLQKRLPTLKVVQEFANIDAVYFGAEVETRDEDGQTRRLRIVGPDEADAQQSTISMDSPLARALLSKRVGDQAQVETRDRKMSVTVVSIRYP